jgi:hypothetical protein
MQVVHAKGSVPTKTTLGEYKRIYFYLYSSFHFTVYSTLVREIDDSLLYLTDSDEEETPDPRLLAVEGCGLGGQPLLDDPL